MVIMNDSLPLDVDSLAGLGVLVVFLSLVIEDGVIHLRPFN